MRHPPQQLISRRIPGGAFVFESSPPVLFTITCDCFGLVVERAAIKSEFELDLFRLALARAFHTREVMREHREVGSCQPW